MPKVFISHSSRDKNFTNFLVKLLEFHHINPWYDSSDILLGSKFPQKIEDALNNSESLIAVISKNSLQSDWVKREIIYFRAKSPNNLVPLILDDTEPRDFYKLTPDLEQYQAINLNKGMLAGLEKLMAYFDREFLPSINRRSLLERRNLLDRRKAKIDQRMRIGFWKSYENRTGIGKFERLPMSIHDQAKMIRALKSEVSKYSYNLQGKIQEHEKVLEEAVINAPDFLRSIDMDYKAALESVYKLFQLTRDVIRNHGRNCIEFTKIAIIVLNQVIRPFTVKWHKLSLQSAFKDPDKCRLFRAELEELQKILKKYTRMLADMAGVEDLTSLEAD